jgi:hypothetical protein
MSDTNDNSDSTRKLAQAVEANTEQLRNNQSLEKSRKASFQGLQNSFIKFVAPMTRLQSSINRMDETNRKVLMSAGTTYAKLEKSLEKNSSVLDKNLVSNRALISEIAKNFGEGIRINNGAITDLTQEMIATGQNTALQRKMNADQVLQTGNNTKAVQSINKTNKDVSDKYGVSNDRLIESLNSLKGVMDQASFFGPEAVTSFKNISMELKGKAGGSNIEGGLAALFKVIGPGSEGIAASRLLGAGGLRQKVAAGGSIGTEDLAPIFANLERIIGSSKGEFGAEIAGAKTGLGKDQMVQLMQLNNIMKSSFELSKDEKATQDEKFNTLKNLQDKQNDWYDSGAGKMLGLLGGIDSSLIFMVGSIAQGGGITETLRGMLPGGGGKGGKVGPGQSKGTQAGIGALTGASKGNRLAGGLKGAGVGLGLGMGIGALGDAALGEGTLSNTAMGVGMGAIAGPWGMAIGALVGGVMDIANYTGESSKADKERVAQEKEKLDRERAEENSNDIKRLNWMTGYLRSRSNSNLFQDEEVKEYLRVMAEEAVRDKSTLGKTVNAGGR